MNIIKFKKCKIVKTTKNDRPCIINLKRYSDLNKLRELTRSRTMNYLSEENNKKSIKLLKEINENLTAIRQGA